MGLDLHRRAPCSTRPAASLFVLAALSGALLLVCGCASPSSTRKGTGPGLSKPPLRSAPLSGRWHRVRRGETLGRIARDAQVPLQDLAEINDLVDPDLLVVGQEIFVPEADHDEPVGAARQRRTSKRPPPRTPPTEPSAPQKVKRPRGIFIWPVVGGRLTSRFGRRWGRQHNGIDVAAPMGTPLRAAADGTVIYSGTARGYGNLVLIKHGDRYVTVYGHCKVNRVRKGQKVRQGQTVALLGNTGRSTGPHVHFEIRDRGKARNPLFFLPPKMP